MPPSHGLSKTKLINTLLLLSKALLTPFHWLMKMKKILLNMLCICKLPFFCSSKGFVCHRLLWDDTLFWSLLVFGQLDILEVHHFGFWIKLSVQKGHAWKVIKGLNTCLKCVKWNGIIRASKTVKINRNVVNKGCSVNQKRTLSNTRAACHYPAIDVKGQKIFLTF